MRRAAAERSARARAAPDARVICHRAAWLLPMTAPPVRDGWVAVDAGRIVARGGPDDDPPRESREVASAEPIAILPGLVNAHTHLELSWMEGRVPPAASMPEWVEALMVLRRTRASEPVAPIEAAVAALRASGTSLVGDITNTFAAYRPLLASPLSACVFRELLGFGTRDGEAAVARAWQEAASLEPSPRLRVSVVPHAPYSVSPPLLRAIAAAAGERVISIHLAESSAEVAFTRSGDGAWKDLLMRFGAWTDEWQPPRCGPLEYLESFGFVNGRLLAVHGVQLTDEELARLAAAGSTLVTCPRSNRWTGAGAPPVARFYASGVRVAVGTDSLASVDDLNVFGELAVLRALAPDVPARRLLRSATVHGAAALGFGADLGAIEAGRRAELIGVRIPPGAGDVEEYLVSGVSPADISWLDAG